MNERPDRDEPLGPALSSVWSAPVPGADFADRVVAARRRQLGGRAGRAVALTLAATFAVAVLAGAVWRGLGRTSGELIADERASVSIGRRATAVAEAGAAFSFAVDLRGRAVVEQRAGDVFYRVERGGPFVVKTPAGEVHVKGTCFRVEVTNMNAKQALLGATVSAAAASAITATVYEGRIEVRSASGAVEVGPGETVSTKPSAAAAVAAPASSNDPAVRDRAQKAEIARLQAELAALRGPRRAIAQEMRIGGHGKPDDLEQLSKEKFTDFTRDEWAAMAARCELRLQLPPIAFGEERGRIDEAVAAKLGLNPGERIRFAELVRTLGDEHRAALARIYQDLTGENGERLTPMALDTEIRAKSSPGAFAAARKRYAEEKAGLAPPAAAADLSPIDRFVRVQAGAWELFEGKLGAIIGPERARAARNGAEVGRLRAMGCEDE
jgi:hypothetical protein